MPGVLRAVATRLRLFGRAVASHPPTGLVDLGDLARVEPIAREFGFNRGTPIDRYYIESFLRGHQSCIKGRVLEVADRQYTELLGRNVTSSEVIGLAPASQVSIVADLRDAPQLSDDSYDCIICTQTLQFIYETRAAVSTLKRILRPGGTLLVTVPGISQISRYDMERWGDYWRFTSRSSQHLFAEIFGESVEVTAYGNVLASLALLHGLAVGDIGASRLDFIDEDYEVVIGVKAWI